MQIWEYCYILKERGWRMKKGQECLSYDNWKDTVFYSDGTIKVNNGEFPVLLQQLGQEGWELVSVSPRSGHLGATTLPRGAMGTTVLGLPPLAQATDYAGFTDTEVWTFNRLKS